MIQLLQPFLLLSLLGLLVPIAIHLWNRKEGKRIKVGSIALLIASESSRMSSVRLQKIGLLLLRCLLLTLLCLLLTQPNWIRTLSNHKPKGWILLSPDLVTEVKRNKAIQSLIDTLTKNDNNELHLLTAQFPKLDLAKPIDTQQSTEPVNYWSLLREVDRILSTEAKVYVLTSERLQAVQGERPALSLDINWLTFTPKDTTATWLANAYITPDDSLKITWGISQAKGTYYKSISTSLPTESTSITPTGLPTTQVRKQNGFYSVKLAQQPFDELLADTITYKISIFHDSETKEDARYVQAAIKAVETTSKRKIRLQTFSEGTSIDTNTHWLFWLSTKPLSGYWQNRLKKKGTRILAYAPTKKINNTSTSVSLPIAPTTAIPVFKQLDTTLTGMAIWKDGSGQGILTATQQGKGKIFYLNTRFHPNWNDLVWQEVFPQNVFSLLNEALFLKDQEPEPTLDKRVISAQQLIPKHRETQVKKAPIKEIISLYEILWILAVFVFGVERWLSDKKVKAQKGVPA